MINGTLRAPSTASTTAGANAGANRRARPNRNAASSTAPATSAARPAWNASSGSGISPVGGTPLSASQNPSVSGPAADSAAPVAPFDPSFDEAAATAEPAAAV